VSVDVVEVGSGVWHARAQHVGWMLVADGGEITLVDSGYPGDRAAVIASVERVGRSPADVAAVLLTHAHPDHIGSAEYLRTSVSTAVWAHEQEAAHACGEVIEQVSTLTLLRMLWRSDVRSWVSDIRRLDATKAERVGAVETFLDGHLDVPGRPRVVHTPGHTRGHSALHFPERGVLHVGDALMTAHAMSRRSGPQPALDFFDADHQQALDSLQRIAPLPADVVVPGHGPPFYGTPARAVELALAL
jgi:glyoxylase-like metal-dependent hydrolase (beta-lactamase superfamily II)